MGNDSIVVLELNFDWLFFNRFYLRNRKAFKGEAKIEDTHVFQNKIEDTHVFQNATKFSFYQYFRNLEKYFVK